MSRHWPSVRPAMRAAWPLVMARSRRRAWMWSPGVTCFLPMGCLRGFRSVALAGAGRGRHAGRPVGRRARRGRRALLALAGPGGDLHGAVEHLRRDLVDHLPQRLAQRIAEALPLGHVVTP